MADYKSSYFALMGETEQVIQQLIAARRRCAEALANAPEDNRIFLPGASGGNREKTQKDPPR